MSGPETGSSEWVCWRLTTAELLAILLRGWANYYRHSAASYTFNYVGHYAFQRMELWLRKKTRQRIGRFYWKYYRRHNGYLTWVAGGKGLFNPGVLIRIRRKRYFHRPNPYLDNPVDVELPYHLSPYPGKRHWQGYHHYGEKWTVTREQVLKRDGYRCRICGIGGRVEVHHLRKHKPD